MKQNTERWLQEDPHVYVPITRIDEEKRMVYGYGTREDLVDSYGTVIDLESVKKCLPGYLKWRTVREMHQPSAVGRADEITVDDVGVYLGSYVVDDIAWKKVKEGVYKGFSLGGKKDRQEGNRVFLKEITEFSLVDRPSNEGCAIDEYRIFGTESDLHRLESLSPEQQAVELVKRSHQNPQIIWRTR